MTRVICAEQITDPNPHTTSQDTLFIVEIGVNTQPKIIFEKGSPNNGQITATTTGAKYYKITDAGQPSESQASASKAIESKELVPASKSALAAASAVSASKAALAPGPTTATTPAAAAAASAVSASKAALASGPTTATTPAAASATESKVLPQAQAPAPVPDTVCGLTNPSSMCYLNSAIQLLLDIPEIPEYFNKKTDEPIKYAIGPQCKTMPNGADQTKYNKNIKLLQHIFNTIKINSAKTPKTATDIIKIKTQDTPQTAAPSAENTAYYELAKSNEDAFLNDQAMLKEIVLANPDAYPDVTPANVDEYINTIIAPLEKKYSQADPGEFLSALFFPNFLCVDDPKNFTKIIGLNESSEIECENKKKYDTDPVYSPIIELRTDKTNKTISDLLVKHKEIEQIDGKSDQCGTAPGLIGNQNTKQIKHTLQTDTKYIILYLNRNVYNNAGQQEKNTTKIDITKEITINNVQFRIKGCIFHVGPVGGGHYVYGSYDKDGNPKHVRDDDKIIEKPDGIAPKVFDQDGYQSTVCLYERVESQTQNQLIKAGSTKTKKRKHKNKKRKTQHTKRN
jgi:hypothetical protein